MPLHRTALARVLAVLALLAAFVALVAVISGSLGNGSDRSERRNPQGQISPKNTTNGDRGKKVRRFYVVQPEDTAGLSSVSERTGVSIARLQALNPEVDPQLIQIGQRLRIR
jgi:LysM repeat protein